VAERLLDRDPRAVLRDHGLSEQIDHPSAQKQFETACKLGNVEAVRAHVALGIDVNRCSETFEQHTPLLLAVEHDQCEVVRVLVAAGADLQARDHGGRTAALMTAIEHAHPTLLRTLLELGASPDVPDNRRVPPLVEALERGKAEIIEVMLGSSASTTTGAAVRRSALQWCVFRKDVARLRELLARPDADPNLASEEGYTLLHFAVHSRNADAIDALLGAGADPHRTNTWGWNPHELAVALAAQPLATRFERLGVPLNLTRAVAYFQAIRTGKRDVVIEALDGGVAIETRDWAGFTGFLRAVSVGNREIAELLHERGADIDALEGDDYNALSQAEDNALRKWLLQLGVAVSYRDSHGGLRQPGLTVALAVGDPELLRIVLDAPEIDLSDLSDCRHWLLMTRFEDGQVRRADTLRALAAAGADLEVVDNRGRSLLFDYIAGGVEPCVMALLELGVDIEREDDRLATPLIESCDTSGEDEIQARITAALLARGADPSKTNWLDMSAWECAKTNDNFACMEVLERWFEGRRIDVLAEPGRCDLESFQHWVRRREYALVRELLRAGFDPNRPPLTRHGKRPSESPLTIAIETDEQMVEILLEGGADPNLVLSNGDTALFGAISPDEIGILRRLLAAGADPNVCDDDGHSPMSWAASSGNLEVMEVLHEAGASVQPRASGPLPLWEAARCGHLEAVRWLLARAADVDARNEGRVTALVIAIQEGKTEVALELIAAGADVDVQTSDVYRDTALLIATKLGHAQQIEALLAAGADPMVRDAAGRSSIELAADSEELRALFVGGERTI
jgi:ankyrin repeat protein